MSETGAVAHLPQGPIRSEHWPPRANKVVVCPSEASKRSPCQEGLGPLRSLVDPEVNALLYLLFEASKRVGASRGSVPRIVSSASAVQANPLARRPSSLTPTLTLSGGGRGSARGLGSGSR